MNPKVVACQHPEHVTNCVYSINWSKQRYILYQIILLTNKSSIIISICDDPIVADYTFLSMWVRWPYHARVCIQHRWSIASLSRQATWKSNQNPLHHCCPVHVDAVPDRSEYCLQNKICRCCISFQSNVPIISAFRLIVAVNWPHICCTWNTS